MPTAFLIVSCIGLLFTINAFRPLRVELFSVPVFFAGWLTSELPLQHLAWEAVATAVFIALGALRSTAGLIGLALTIVSWSGLIVLAVQAGRAGGVLEEALKAGLGETYRQRMAPHLSHSDGPTIEWSRLLLPFWMRHPDVEVIRGLPYAPDGTKAHRLDLYRPRAQPGGAPVLLYLHGGAWVLGDKREQGIPIMLHLAAHGWICVTANYRLSPKARFPDHLIDCKQALAWIKANIAEYGGDPSFVVVSGGSAGGHLASLVALTPNDPAYQPTGEEVDTSVAACIPLYGVYDFTNRYSLRGPGFIRYLLERMVMPVGFEADRRAYELASPLDRIHEGAPPFMVVQGANDTLVPVGEARHFADLLQARSHAPVVYAELPGAQHAFEVFRSIRTAHVVRAVGEFLAVAYQARVEPRET
jgi:acetyl esterase/lipase